MPGSNGLLVESTNREIQQIVGRDLGQDDWGSKVNHVSFSSATEFAHTIRNLSTGGHLSVKRSTDGANLLSVLDSGTTVNALTVTGGLISSGDLTLDGRLIMAQAVSKIVGGVTSLSIRDHTDSADNLLVTDVGAVTARTALTIAAGPLAMGEAASRLVPGATSFSVRNNANGADNLLISNAGAVTVRAGLTVTAGGLTVTAGGATVTAGDLAVTAGKLTMAASASQLVPGATSFSVRNNANNADNLLISDAGVVTARAGLTVTAGNLAVSSGTITASSTVQGTRLISTVAIGTAPLTVTSTTVVPNLNASFLEGHPAADFLTGLSGAVLTDGSSQTKSGALTIQGTFSTEGNTTLGNASADALTVNATGTYNNVSVIAATGFQASSGFIRMENNTAIKARNNAHGGDIDLVKTDASDNLIVGGTSNIATLFVVSNGATEIWGGSSSRIKCDGTGLSFFAGSTAGKQTVTGSKGANAALTSLLTALATYGLITDSST